MQKVYRLLLLHYLTPSSCTLFSYKIFHAYRAATAAMTAANAPPRLTAPRATAALDGRAEEEADAPAALALVAREKVVEASVASVEGEVMAAVELEKPVGAAVGAASELMVSLPAAVALAEAAAEAEPDAEGVKASLAMPNWVDHW